MADKVILEAEVKSNIKAVTAETKQLTNEFGAFGVTIGGIKQKFADVGQIMMNGLTQIKLQAQLAGVGLKNMFSGNIIGGAKTLFKVIRTGIAATGIGALVIAFTSLVLFLTKTKKGADLLKVAMAAIGATIRVVTDRIAAFGGGLIKLFTDSKGGIKDMKNSFKGVGAEIVNSTNAAIRLQNQLNSLTDRQRKLNVETAQQRTEIEKLKMTAEDVTKTENERLAAAESAFEKENALLKRRVANAKEDVAIQKESNSLKKEEAADLDALAEKQIALAGIEGESTTKQIELNNKINAIKAEAQSKEDARRSESAARREEQRAEELASAQEIADATATLAEKTAQILLDIRFKGIEDEEELAQAQLQAQFEAQQKEIENSKATQLQKDEAAEALLSQHEINKAEIVQQFKDIAQAKTDEEAIALLELQQENQLAEMKNLRARALEELRIQEEKEMAELEGKENAEALALEIDKKYARLRNVVNKEADKTDEENSRALKDMKIGFALQGLSAIQQIAGEGTALAKAAALAQATISGTQSVINAFKTASDSPLNAIVPGYNFIQAGLAGAFAAANIAKIASSSPPDTNITPPDTTSQIDTGPAPQMMSGAFELGGGITPEPMKAFVVTDEMTNSQDQLANIRRTATI